MLAVLRVGGIGEIECYTAKLRDLIRLWRKLQFLLIEPVQDE